MTAARPTQKVDGSGSLSCVPDRISASGETFRGSASGQALPDADIQVGFHGSGAQHHFR